MIKIDKELVQELLAIADVNDDDDYVWLRHAVIEQLKNDNELDDDAMFDFLSGVENFKDEILEEEEK